MLRGGACSVCVFMPGGGACSVCVFMPGGGACSVYNYMQSVCIIMCMFRGGPCTCIGGRILCVLQQGVTDAVVLVTGSTEANISINTSCYYNLKVL